MFPGATKGGGKCFAFPDVCKTPAPTGAPPLIPYANIGMLNQAKKTATKVKFAGKEVITKKSEIPRSSGDEAGVAKGVMSSKNMDKGAFKKGSATVIVQGQPCVHLTIPTGHNGSNANAFGGIVNVANNKVFVG